MKNAPGKQGKHVVLLLMLAVSMFGFAFALVPLYTVFCELTGLNGKVIVSLKNPELESRTYQAEVDDQTTEIREVEIQFLAHVGTGMPWEFRPMERQKRVRLGRSSSTTFYVRNRADYAVIGQAIPSVAPGKAALHLNKTECFCFTQQRLEAGEEMEMPVTFSIDTELPSSIRTLSLSYTLYKVEEVKPI